MDTTKSTALGAAPLRTPLCPRTNSIAWRGPAEHRRNAMRIRIIDALAACALILHSAPVPAQVGEPSSPLGVTSPLGVGPSAPVGPAGIPLGATELAAPGESPPPPGASPLGSAAVGVTTCSGTAASPGTPMGATAPFDGGGTSGTASGTCAPAGHPTTVSGTPSPSPPVGRSGIPLGASELSPGGLSPPPLVVPPSPLISPVPPSPTLGLSAPPASSPFLGSSPLSTGGATFGSSQNGGSTTGR
jgi:hypothetical protein